MGTCSKTFIASVFLALLRPAQLAPLESPRMIWKTSLVLCTFVFKKRLTFNKQLLDEVEYDIMNYRNRGLCYEVLIIHDIMRKPNSMIVLLYIFHIIHPQKQTRSVQPFCFWGEHSKGLSNQADVELDMINAISAADIAFIMSSS